MATFSQQFLANLGRPQMAQGLFGLGQAIGGVPGQMRQRRQQEQFNALMSQAQASLGRGDVGNMKVLSRQLGEAGYTQQAQQLMQSAVQLEEQQKQKMQEQFVTRGEKALTNFGSTAEANLTDPKVRENFFRLATTYNVPFETANNIYKAFTGTDAKGGVTKGQEVNLRDAQGNYYTSVVQYNAQGQPTRTIVPQPGSPAKPQGRLTVVSGTTGAGAFDQPGLAGERTVEQNFNENRVAAVTKLPALRRSANSMRQVIDLLESGDVKTGGFTRRLSRGVTDFLGTTPKDIGEFETRLGDVVLARLENFKGAISEGERLFLIEQVGNYRASGESNLGRLQAILEQAEGLIQDAITLGTAPDFESYRQSVMKTDVNLDFIPQAEREEARQALQNGQVTLEQLRDMY